MKPLTELRTAIEFDGTLSEFLDHLDAEGVSVGGYPIGVTSNTYDDLVREHEREKERNRAAAAQRRAERDAAEHARVNSPEYLNARYRQLSLDKVDLERDVRSTERTLKRLFGMEDEPQYRIEDAFLQASREALERTNAEFKQVRDKLVRQSLPLPRVELYSAEAIAADVDVKRVYTPPPMFVPDLPKPDGPAFPDALTTIKAREGLYDDWENDLP